MLFTDDSKPLAIIKNAQDIELLLPDIVSLTEWSRVWEMSFKADKCKLMSFSKRRQVDQPPIPIFMTSPSGQVHQLEKTSSERDLGIIILNNLKWADQVAFARANAYSM